MRNLFALGLLLVIAGVALGGGAGECGERVSTDIVALRLAPCVSAVDGVALDDGARGAGECGGTSADVVAIRLAPCASAIDDPQSTPTSSCCAAVNAVVRRPSCLCAVILSGTARAAGIKLEVAITLPKRCNIADRPVGYKCGDYTMP